jgi:hypothetical protein
VSFYQGHKKLFETNVVLIAKMLADVSIIFEMTAHVKVNFMKSKP